MLDIKLIRQNPDLVAEQLQKKKFTLNTAEFLRLMQLANKPKLIARVCRPSENRHQKKLVNW